ncbi:MAG: hypothetical protein DKINENOH_05139 [bacterium]|nr:hypothetical protein [bacterium]
MKKAIALLIIGISLAPVLAGGKQSATAAAGVTESSGPANSRLEVPAALVGRWSNGSITAANFYNSEAQQWRAPQGTGLFLTVQADGRYALGGGECVGAGEEAITYFFYQEGTIIASESQVVLNPFTGTDYTQCGGLAAREEQWLAAENELQPSTFRFQIVAATEASGKATLVLINEQGEQVSLRQSAE